MVIARARRRAGCPIAEDNRQLVDRTFLLVPAQAAVAQWLESFKEFPIRQKPASFNLDEVMRRMSETKQ